jgi:hypothetical protein
MPFHSYRRPPTADSARAARPRFTTRYRPEPELPAPVLMLGLVTFRDRDGIWWTVREERAAGGTAAGRLLFESPGIARRLTHYPASWRTLSTAALVLLAAAG